MNPMTTTDRAILEFLSAEPQPIRILLDAYPKATVYARLRALQSSGLVAKRGREYLLTTPGLQAKAQREGAAALDGLTGVYGPLREVPSPQHRALVELAISALVLRQLTDQEEHHAGFLLVGPPMTWKSAGGRFLCLAAGADPATCVVDLAAESGRSLWVRRGAAGDIRSQRALLSAPVIVLDEYGHADRAVRQAVAPFISGRRRVPVENEILPITPVPVITMNPRPGATVSARTGFSLAQLRRLVPCDLGAVSLPDLALEGGRAIEAARQAGSLALRAPRGSCEAFRAALVQLLRQMLVPESVGLVDVELLLGLGRGLSGWLTPVAAMRQAVYDFLLVVETVGWVRPGWLEAVRAFPDRGEGAISASPGARAPVMPTPQRAHPPQTISLFPERMTSVQKKEHPAMNSRDSMLPAFAISDHTKTLMAWFAVDAGTSLDQVVEILVEIYRMQRADDVTFHDLLAVVRLREECETAEIAVSDLRTAVELTVGLRERGLSLLDDIPTTLQVAKDLDEAGLSLKDAVAVAGLMKAMKKAGVNPGLPEQLQAALDRYATLGYDAKKISRLASLSERLRDLGLGLDDLEPVVAQFGRLTELGLDGSAAEGLATTLSLASVPEAERGAVFSKAVELGQAGITLADVQADRHALEDQVQLLRHEQAGLEGALAEKTDELARIQQELDQARTELDGLRDKALLLEDAVAAGQALQGFLLGNLDVADEFFVRVAAIRELRRKGSQQFPGLETWLTAAIQQGVLDFLKRISTLPPMPSGQGTTPKG
jgi:hypothetical protein